MVTKKKHYWNVVIFSYTLLIIFAIFDVIGAYLWTKAGGWEGQAYLTAGIIYQAIFWSMAYLTIAAIAITYYLTKKDKSESLALLFIPLILLQFGVEDVIFYFLSGLNVFHDTMPWLMGHLWGPTIMTQALGQTVINGGILFISAIIGILISFLVAAQLEKIKG